MLFLVFCSWKHLKNSHFTIPYIRTIYIGSISEKAYPEPNDIKLRETVKKYERKPHLWSLTLQMSQRRPMTLALHSHWPVRESQISEKEPFMWQWQAAEEEEGDVSLFPEAKSNSQMFRAAFATLRNAQPGLSRKVLLPYTDMLTCPC